MKRLIMYFKALCMVGMSAILLTSCLNDDGYSLDTYRISYATARPLSDKSFYFTLDNGTTLWPAAPLNIYYQPARPQRVQINYTLLGDHFQGYDYAMRINQMDTILTKAPAADMKEKNDSIYGNDAVGLSDLWIGDGFLNAIFKIEYSGQFKHAINLLRDTTSYELELRHNSFEDKSSSQRYGIVAFDLSGIDTKGEDVELIIRIKTFDGVKEYKRKYNSASPAKTKELQPELKLELQPELNLDKNSLE